MNFRRASIIAWTVVFFALGGYAFASSIFEDKAFQDAYKIKKCFQDKQYSKALKLSNQYIKAHPKSYVGYHLRAIANSSLGRRKLAKADIDKAISINPQVKVCHSNLTNYYIQIRDYKAAFKEARTCLMLDPATREKNEFKYLCRKLGLDFKKELAKTRGADNLLWMGLNASYKGENKKALSYYNQYIKKHPRTLFGYQYRGDLHRYMKNYDLAIKDYNTALKYHPESSLVSLAKAYQLTGQNELALKCHRLANQLCTSRTMLFDMGKTMMTMKRYKEAIGVFTRVAKITQEDADAFRLRGDCYAKTKQYKLAIADYSRSLRYSFKPSPSTFRERAKAYRAIGNKKLWLKDLENAKRAEKSRMVSPI